MSTRVAKSINPHTSAVEKEYPLWTDAQATAAADRAAASFQKWKKSSFAERGVLLNKAAGILRAKKGEFAKIMAIEMGKPLAQGSAEVEKCAAICEYYAARAEEMLAPEFISKEHAMTPLPGSKQFVTFNPLGTVLIIMPWNFPFWQVFRQAATALAAGNTMMLKHASNVFGCAYAIESVMTEAGFPQGVFQTLPIGGVQASKLIEHPGVRAVAVTGSTPVGKKIGAAAGALLKPHVLELGGSDPYLVLHDADIDLAVGTSVSGRLLNCGQSCIGAKRFIAVASVYDEFLEKFTKKMQAAKFGNPLTEGCEMGPMVDTGAREEIHKQVLDSIAAGAKLMCGGYIPEGPGAYYPPTVLADVTPGQPAYHEELFGPVASVIKVKDEAEAIRVANEGEFGLGAGVFTRDVARGERIAAQDIDAGLCFVNDFVKSHQALPFGGVKESGVGRECGEYGIKAFVNIKTVVVK